MIKPASIHPGDTIGIIATGRKINKDAIFYSKQIIESLGFKVQLGKNLFSSQHSYLSGSDEERLSDMQNMMDDPSVKVILCARGGYGTTRILDQLAFTSFMKNPKWVCGFSDVTALHLKLQSLGIQSIHSTMPVLFPKEESKSSIDSLMKILLGTSQNILVPGSIHNKSGEAKGVLTGGNLSLVTDSLGTSTEINTDGKILIVEEVDEYLYRIDRMLVQLKRAGKLQKLAGLLIGHMTDLKDTELPFGETVYEIILSHTKEFKYPIAFNFPTGHENPNLAWISGATGQLSVSAEGSVLKF